MSVERCRVYPSGTGIPPSDFDQFYAALYFLISTLSICSGGAQRRSCASSHLRSPSLSLLNVISYANEEPIDKHSGRH